MDKIQIFKNQIFGNIRVAEQDGNPMFCLADVCKALDIKNPSQCKTRLNESGLIVIDLNLIQDNGVFNNEGVNINELGNRSATFISESNLYKCIFQSRRPDAEKFQDWVCDEVLPSIRRHGAYMTGETIEKAITSPDFLIRLATELKAEQQKRMELEAKNKILSDINAAQYPKAIFADAVMASSSSCLIGELAKILTQNGIKIGQNRLFSYLRQHDYLGRHGERYNVPNQQYIEQGIFEIKKNVHFENGSLKTTSTPKCTAKGQLYFINKFINNTNHANN